MIAEFLGKRDESANKKLVEKIMFDISHQFCWNMAANPWSLFSIPGKARLRCPFRCSAWSPRCRSSGAGREPRDGPGMGLNTETGDVKTKKGGVKVY